jgi:hypothetical protein
VSKDVPRAQTFVAVLNFGLARPEIEREADALRRQQFLSCASLRAASKKARKMYNLNHNSILN